MITYPKPLTNIMTEQRIIELEIKVAYQEDLLQDLNSIVTQQQQQIDRLETVCKQLVEHLRNIQTNHYSEAEGNQTPPHY